MEAEHVHVGSSQLCGSAVNKYLAVGRSIDIDSVPCDGVWITVFIVCVNRVCEWCVCMVNGVDFVHEYSIPAF
jgi:hypothetical protein